MAKLFVSMIVLMMFFLYMSENSTPLDEITNTTCTITDIVLIDKYVTDYYGPIGSFMVVYQYYQIVEIMKNKSLIRMKKIKSVNDYIQDLGFINQTMACYLVHDQVEFSYPSACDERCLVGRFILVCVILLFFVGLLSKLYVI